MQNTEFLNQSIAIPISVHRILLTRWACKNTAKTYSRPNKYF